VKGAFCPKEALERLDRIFFKNLKLVKNSVITIPVLDRSDHYLLKADFSLDD